MALDVEDGTGKSTSESFASVSELDSYYSLRTNPSSWTSLTTAQKESKARLATDYLENKYKLRWTGARRLDTQALAWPRDGVVTREGWAVDNDIVPTVVKSAQAEVILIELDGDTLEPSTNGNIKQAKAAVIEVTYVGGKSDEKFYPKVERLLQEYLMPLGRLERG